MKVTIPPLLAGCLLFVAFCGCSTTKPTPDDGLEPFQGSWVVVELNDRGKQVDSQKKKILLLEFTKDQFAKKEVSTGDTLGLTSFGLGTAAAGGTLQGGTVRADVTKSPNEIDVVRMEGLDLGKAQLGIYAFEDGKLKLCFADFGEPRPTEFASGPKRSLWVLQPKP